MQCPSINHGGHTLGGALPYFPLRKKLIKQERQEEKDITTYASAIKTATMTNPIAPSLPYIDKDTHLKIYTCMMHAHIMNITGPGCYEEEPNATLTANKLPNIKIPKAPNSKKLIKILSSVGRLMDLMGSLLLFSETVPPCFHLA